MCEDGVGTWRCGMWEKEDVCTRGRERRMRRCEYEQGAYHCYFYIFSPCEIKLS